VKLRACYELSSPAAKTRRHRERIRAAASTCLFAALEDAVSLVRLAAEDKHRDGSALGIDDPIFGYLGLGVHTTALIFKSRSRFSLPGLGTSMARSAALGRSWSSLMRWALTKRCPARRISPAQSRMDRAGRTSPSSLATTYRKAAKCVFDSIADERNRHRQKLQKAVHEFQSFDCAVGPTPSNPFRPFTLHGITARNFPGRLAAPSGNLAVGDQLGSHGTFPLKYAVDFTRGFDLQRGMGAGLSP